ncbi:uncharacterized protein LOC111083603 [Limulus polyphemus]|uniref:Uncharacterized protein LOC111083603 n=1 Tax=Limulus polyphemus TaxID=6850 RepID=A0ABM1RX26_LIMPO|nr:uncharacterized protein LOC111083603 [Limulus polyphemus]
MDDLVRTAVTPGNSFYDNYLQNSEENRLIENSFLKSSLIFEVDKPSNEAPKFHRHSVTDSMINTRGIRSDAWSFSTGRGKVTFHCMWTACKALTIGILLILLGSGMAVVGFYSTHADMDRKANSTNFLENFSRSYKLTSMTYIGPAVMGVGGFIIVATCVLLLEARDAATKVIPIWLWPTHDHKILAVSKNTTLWEVFHAQPQNVSERSKESINPSSSTKGGIDPSQFSGNIHAYHCRCPFQCSLTSKVKMSSYDISSKHQLQIFHPLCSNRQNPGGSLDRSSIMDSPRTTSAYHDSRCKYNSNRVKHNKTYVFKSSSEPTLNTANLAKERVSASTVLEPLQKNKSSYSGNTIPLAVKEYNLQNKPLGNVYRPIVNYHVYHAGNIKSSRTMSNESVPIVPKDSLASLHVYNTFRKPDSFRRSPTYTTNHSRPIEAKRCGKIWREETGETRRIHKKTILTDVPHSTERSYWKKHVAHNKAVLIDVPCSTERLNWKKDMVHKKTILTGVPCISERLNWQKHTAHKKTLLTGVPCSTERLYWKNNMAHKKTILTDVPCSSERLYWKNNMAHKKTILTDVPCSSERLYWKNNMAHKKTILTDVPCSTERLYWKSSGRHIVKTLSGGSSVSPGSDQEEEPKSQSTSTEHLFPRQKKKSLLSSSLLSRFTKRS